ncbi:sensor histidine kinase [Nonomuraea roseoviolacea]|uniref:histidine kinase n=1 Tax=Nonomuraea roseoviolacea subsp. carminata TaxID=160689 RepID=A0ABT1KDG1_9ACTN|nr:sensor histidine kinase [Nonomuraea roseoviolacea]MCP2352052.1 signal transduction histidine kinase [Nonomuraea roseoviolacea subsp. carminata]
MRHVAEGARVAGAVALGAVTAPLEAVFLLLALPFLGNPNVSGAAARLAALEVRRLRLDPAALGLSAGPAGQAPGIAGAAGRPHEGRARPAGARALRFLTLRLPVGVLGGLVVTLFVFGAATALAALRAWLGGQPFDGMEPTPLLVTYLLVAGFVGLFISVSGMIGVYAVERRLAWAVLAPDRTEALERRIAELSESRAGIVAAVDSERRRIERDLHDGLQQRLVALSMLIGRSRRGRPELLDQAHEEAQRALAELREVAWRVYPSGLDALGLGDALAGVAERSSVPVTVTCDLAGRPPMAVETAAYFVVCEAVTNAAKHAGAARIAVDVRRDGAALVVRVEDDGAGGADPAGSGLSGLARRVAALDGTFEVTSPPGGPTTIVVELPCG